MQFPELCLSNRCILLLFLILFSCHRNPHEPKEDADSEKDLININYKRKNQLDKSIENYIIKEWNKAWGFMEKHFPQDKFSALKTNTKLIVYGNVAITESSLSKDKQIILKVHDTGYFTSKNISTLDKEGIVLKLVQSISFLLSHEYFESKVNKISSVLDKKNKQNIITNLEVEFAKFIGSYYKKHLGKELIDSEDLMKEDILKYIFESYEKSRDYSLHINCDFLASIFFQNKVILSRKNLFNNFDHALEIFYYTKNLFVSTRLDFFSPHKMKSEKKASLERFNQFIKQIATGDIKEIPTSQDLKTLSLNYHEHLKKKALNNSFQLRNAEILSFESQIITFYKFTKDKDRIVDKIKTAWTLAHGGLRANSKDFKFTSFLENTYLGLFFPEIPELKIQSELNDFILYFKIPESIFEISQKDLIQLIKNTILKKHLGKDVEKIIEKQYNKGLKKIHPKLNFKNADLETISSDVYRAFNLLENTEKIQNCSIITIDDLVSSNPNNKLAILSGFLDDQEILFFLKTKKPDAYKNIKCFVKNVLYYKHLLTLSRIEEQLKGLESNSRKYRNKLNQYLSSPYESVSKGEYLDIFKRYFTPFDTYISKLQDFWSCDKKLTFCLLDHFHLIEKSNSAVYWVLKNGIQSFISIPSQSLYTVNEIVERTLNHEFTHHIQVNYFKNIPENYAVIATKLDELEADFFAGFYATHEAGLNLSADKIKLLSEEFRLSKGDDRERNNLAQKLKNKIHGTGLEREKAFLLGAELARDSNYKNITALTKFELHAFFGKKFKESDELQK